MDDMPSTGVFERYGSNEMSRRAFYLVLCGVLVWGFIGTAIASTFTTTWEPNIWVFLAVGLGIPIAGICLSAFSSNAFLSFVGFDMWRASTIPATVDNAVDVAVSLYLDIINLFIRILSILAKSKRS